MLPIPLCAMKHVSKKESEGYGKSYATCDSTGFFEQLHFKTLHGVHMVYPIPSSWFTPYTASMTQDACSNTTNKITIEQNQCGRGGVFVQHAHSANYYVVYPP